MRNSKVKLNFEQIVGEIKPLHAVNDVPYAGFAFGSAEKYIKTFVDAGIPYCRLHDLSGRYGSNVFVDVSNIFRNFDADENDAENYDFTFTDKLLELLTENGVKPFYRLGETIENDFAIKRYRTNPPKDNLKWAKICEHIILHYNYGWANGYKYGIEYWEIWNEPDNAEDTNKNQMWGGTPEQFYEMYCVAGNYLKEKFPEIKIGGYGSVGFYSIAQKELDPTANAEAGGSWYFVEYFNNFMNYIKGKDYPVPLDFFTWHSYSNVEQNIIYAKYVRKTLDANGFTKTESNCNEWNPGTSDRCTVRDAVNVASNMLMWQNAPIDMAMYYNARITSSYGGMYDPLTWEPAKCFYSFKAFNKLYTLKNQTLAQSDDNSLLVVGASDGQEVAVMLSNYGEEDTKIEIEGLDGLKEIKYYVIDKNNTFTESEESIIKDGIFNGQTVLLITAKK